MPVHLKAIAIRSDTFPARECYPFSLPILQRTPSVAFRSPVTFFVGENGSGKSTLLEALARAAGIHIWKNNGIARAGFNPHEDKLHHWLSAEWTDGPTPGAFFASQIFRHFSELLDSWAAADPGLFEYFGGQSLLTQSHGQSLMSFFSSRFKIPGLYLLDEPETALSPRTQLALLRILHENAEAGHAQFIIATHSPILLALPKAEILSFDHSTVQPVSYRETDYYTVYKDFLNHPERFRP